MISPSAMSGYSRAGIGRAAGIAIDTGDPLTKKWAMGKDGNGNSISDCAAAESV